MKLNFLTGKPDMDFVFFYSKILIRISALVNTIPFENAFLSSMRG
jgi:hypothetical protein